MKIIRKKILTIEHGLAFESPKSDAINIKNFMTSSLVSSEARLKLQDPDLQIRIGAY